MSDAQIDASDALRGLGWSPVLSESLSELGSDLCPARVTWSGRGRLRLLGPQGSSPARASGRLRHAAESPLDLPAVGDWVAARPGSEALVEHLLPRSSMLVRQAAGRRTEAQVVAANVDVVGVVTSLDEDFNPRRLERYHELIVSGGASPLLILSKLDRCPEAGEQISAAEAVLPGVPVITLSALLGDGVDGLEPWLTPGTTLALIGSSGVGKSTLTNRLLGRETQATGAVRESDGRGRHVTSHRELFQLPSGALLVDTPGMRELSAWASEGPATSGFSDIRELAETCRFRDCQHEAEPGCAVREAIDAGRLEEGRLESEKKLEREHARQAIRQDAAARAAETAKRRAFSRMVRSMPDKRDSRR